MTGGSSGGRTEEGAASAQPITPVGKDSIGGPLVFDFNSHNDQQAA